MDKSKSEFSFNGRSREEVLETIKGMGIIPAPDFENFSTDAVFVDAEYEVLGEFLVEMKVPDPTFDKYMNFVSPNPLVCWDNRAREQIVVLDPGPHWSRNLLAPSIDGNKHQVIRRNFWVDAGCLGTKILAVVTVKRQINYHTENDSLLLDIEQCISADPAEPIYEIGQSVKVLDEVPDWMCQFVIPGTDRAIRLSKKRAAKSVAA